jgi:hypothetical protein
MPLRLKNKQIECNLKLGCLHPVACTRSGLGFPSNATLNLKLNVDYPLPIMIQISLTVIGRIKA